MYYDLADRFVTLRLATFRSIVAPCACPRCALRRYGSALDAAEL
jgi:hypothetical protein